MNEQIFCIFKLSKEKEFPKGIDEVKEWIEEKKRGDGRYHFRNKKPRNLPIGSVVILSIEGKLIGQGIVEKSVDRTPPDDREQQKKKYGYDYEYCLVFNASSLTVYKKCPSVKEVEQKTGLKFGRLFTYVKRRDQYLSILEMADSN